MLSSCGRAAIAAVPLYATLIHAVALSDFRPSLANVPDPCSSVYMDDIPGCTVSDFTPQARCSQSCILGLVAINQQIKVACSEFSAPATSLIALFQAGQGIQALCDVAVVTASTSASLPVIPIGPSTMTLPSPSALTSSLIFDSTTSPLPFLTTSSSSLPGILISTRTPTPLISTATSLPPTVSSNPAPPPLPPSSLSSQSSTASKTTSSATGAQSESSGNDGTGGDPFATPSSAASLAGSWFELLGLSCVVAAFAAYAS